jgi:hypothetical protein
MGDRRHRQQSKGANGRNERVGAPETSLAEPEDRHESEEQRGEQQRPIERIEQRGRRLSQI